MHCDKARQLLAIEPGSESESRELEAHLAECDDCREYLDEGHLVSLLETLPVREPSSGFEDRVVRGALARAETRSVHSRWALATAASVLVAVLVTMQFTWNDDPAGSVEAVQATIVELRPMETRLVNVRLVSPRTMADAAITVHLADNVELEGYEGVHELQWHTALEQGANQLSLPVRLLDEQPGMVTVVLEHDGASKRLLIKLNAKPVGNDGQTLTMV